MANVNVRVKDDVKKQVEEVFDEIGISLSGATNMFYTQVIRRRAIPFDLIADDPFYSEANQAELNRRIAEYESGETKLIPKTIAELEAME